MYQTNLRYNFASKLFPENVKLYTLYSFDGKEFSMVNNYKIGLPLFIPIRLCYSKRKWYKPWEEPELLNIVCVCVKPKED